MMRCRPYAARCRLNLEVLEDRLAPAALALRNLDLLAMSHPPGPAVLADLKATGKAGPVIAIQSPHAGLTTNHNLTITGHVTDKAGGTMLQARVDAGALLHIKLLAAGRFTFMTRLALNGTADGSHLIQFKATDAKHHAALLSFRFVLATQLPDTIAPQLDAVLAGDSDGDGITANPSITGTATDNVGVVGLTASLDGGSSVDISGLLQAGSFTITAAQLAQFAGGTLADGPHGVHFEAQDRAGNVGTADVSFVLDTTGPSVNVTSPAANELTRQPPVIAGQIVDAFSAVRSLQQALDGGVFTGVSLDASGRYTFQSMLPTDGSADGRHTYQLQAADAQGNIRTTSISFTLDTVAPALTVTSPAANAQLSAAPMIVGTVADSTSGLAAFEAAEDAGSFAAETVGNAGSFSFPTAVTANGPHVVHLRATDQAGNVATLDVPFTLQVTSGNPAVAFAAPAFSGSESIGQIEVPVTLSAAQAQTVAVDYAVTGGTAAGSGVDFTLAAGTLTFQPGQTLQTIPLQISADGRTEADRTVQITLSNASNIMLGTSTVFTYTILENGTPAAPPGQVVYRGTSGDIYRIDVLDNATPVDLTTQLNTIAPLPAGTAPDDQVVNTSANGQWLVMTTNRFDPNALGFAALAIVNGDLSAGQSIHLGDGSLIHPEGMSAVSNDGLTIVYESSGGPHQRDLFAIKRASTSATVWSMPVLLTASSTFDISGYPNIAADGGTVVFDGVNATSYLGGAGDTLCEASTDGTMFRIVARPSDRPPNFVPFATPQENFLHQPAYAPDGSIVFEADWVGGTEQIWRIPPGATDAQLASGAQSAQLVNGMFTNDNSPAVLPDGRIVSLWLGRAGGTGLHEIKVMSPDGSVFIMPLINQEPQDIGYGAGT